MPHHTSSLRYLALVLAVLTLASCISTITLAEDAKQPVVVGYLPHYRAASWLPERVGPVTDLILFAAQPGEDGTLDAGEISKQLLDKAKSARRISGCRVLVCVGGWERSNHFAAVVADDARRGKSG